MGYNGDIMDSVISGLGSITVFCALYFEVFLLISLFEKKEKEVVDKEYCPPVSVIVPVFNEERTIESTLESLLSLDYDKDSLTIIIVNDGSTDNTGEVIKRYESNPQIKIINKQNGGKYTALNEGISVAETEFIGCLDADSFVERHALRRIMSRFADPKVMAVTPSMVINKPNNVIRHMQKAEYDYGNLIRKALAIMGAIHITPGPFSFFRKEVFSKIGTYKHAHNTEDMEMAMRMQRNRMRIAHAPDALVYTVGPSNVGKLYKQRVRWVSGFISNLIDYKDMLFSKQYGDLGLLVLPFSVFGIFMTMVFIAISIYHGSKDLFDAMVQYSVTGLSSPQIHLDWFYFNTSVLSLLSIMFLCVIIALSMYGDRSTSGKWRFSLSILYFVFLYSFISPFWLLRSVYNNLMSKETTWR